MMFEVMIEAPLGVVGSDYTRMASGTLVKYSAS